MEMQKLKTAMESIEMPAPMQERIRNNCLTEMEEYPMKQKKTKPLKRAALIAAALVLCLPVIGMAVSNTGMFKDIKNIFGAVTGTEYENATDEITVTLAIEGKELLVNTTFVNTGIPPYNECEMLSIGTYQFLDETGKVILEGDETTSVMVTEGQAVFCFSADGLKKGTYTLKIDSFISSKKADQPLPIHGSWEIPFSI